MSEQRPRRQGVGVTQDAFDPELGLGLEEFLQIIQHVLGKPLPHYELWPAIERAGGMLYKI